MCIFGLKLAAYQCYMLRLYDFVCTILAFVCVSEKYNKNRSEGQRSGSSITIMYSFLGFTSYAYEINQFLLSCFFLIFCTGRQTDTRDRRDPKQYLL